MKDARDLETRLRELPPRREVHLDVIAQKLEKSTEEVEVAIRDLLQQRPDFIDISPGEL